MPARQTFYASATVSVQAFAPDIWALWVDVNAWNTWNRGVDRSVLHGNFRPGNALTLVPKGAEPVEVIIKTVTQGDEFSDEATLPFGTIRTFHQMEPHDGLVRVTHAIEAEVDCDHAGTFAREAWVDMQRNLAESLNDMVDIVDAS